MSKNIIVVDDDEDILNIIELILIEAGYHVRAVSDIVSFYSIHEFSPDLILLDDWLADGYGSKLCLDLKQNPRTSNIPVILISAKNDLKNIAKACLADDFIPKPFDLDFFTTKINNWLLNAIPR
ncbi:response regulator [Mucilaginibacter flavus]|uniref:response regulator n=1 Tax=Mucilaginibacter flavus TaxID=931504 RepID=UPI0025B4D542|nr:response regulator [Mucilaginibacter flavus]MDN3584504.1 response regulator [Mucilaginibacter flavus]